MLYQNTHESGDSEIIIADEVIAAIAYNTAKDVDGVTGLVARPTDIKSKFSSSEKVHGIKVISRDSDLQIDVSLKLDSSASIPAVASAVQSSVKDAVQSMTGKTVTKVNISVADVTFESPKEDN